MWFAVLTSLYCDVLLFVSDIVLPCVYHCVVLPGVYYIVMLPRVYHRVMLLS